MNNKEFIVGLSQRMGQSVNETAKLVDSFLEELTEQLMEGNSISIHGFGVFEVKKKMEHVFINPLTKQRMLVPPKLILTYKPSTILKDKLK